MYELGSYLHFSWSISFCKLIKCRISKIGPNLCLVAVCVSNINLAEIIGKISLPTTYRFQFIRHKCPNKGGESSLVLLFWPQPGETLFSCSQLINIFLSPHLTFLPAHLPVAGTRASQLIMARPATSLIASLQLSYLDK